MIGLVNWHLEPSCRYFFLSVSVCHVEFTYVSGVVLFPEATLPLRVIQSNFIAAIERVLTHFDTPNTIGVVCAQL